MLLGMVMAGLELVEAKHAKYRLRSRRPWKTRDAIFFRSTSTTELYIIRLSGDMVLLYCTSSYAGYAKSIPAMGLITAVDHDQRDFWYDFMPFEEPVPLDFVRFVVTDDDRSHIANMRHEWLFQISRESFRSVMQGAKLKSNRPSTGSR